MFAVTVTFSLVPEARETFLPLMTENAATSLQTETGCHQFDVATDPDRPDEVFLYELYTDPAAFETHLQSAHFISFDAATRAMISSKQVRTFRKVSQ